MFTFKRKTFSNVTAAEKPKGPRVNVNFVDSPSASVPPRTQKGPRVNVNFVDSPSTKTPNKSSPPPESNIDSDAIMKELTTKLLTDLRSYAGSSKERLLNELEDNHEDLRAIKTASESVLSKILQKKGPSVLAQIWSDSASNGKAYLWFEANVWQFLEPYFSGKAAPTSKTPTPKTLAKPEQPDYKGLFKVVMETFQDEKDHLDNLLNGEADLDSEAFLDTFKTLIYRDIQLWKAADIRAFKLAKNYHKLMECVDDWAEEALEKLKVSDETSED